MADDRIRSLERRFKQSGSLDDEAAWLAARNRAGEISDDQLELAADLAHDPARLALNKPPLRYLDLSVWSRELHDRWGQAVLVRVALATTRHLLATIRPDELPEGAGEAWGWIENSLGAVDEWVGCPCKQHAGAVRRRVQGWRRRLMLHLEPAVGESCARAVLETLHTVAPPNRHTRGFEAAGWVADALGTARVRAVVAADVVPWALGDRNEQ